MKNKEINFNKNYQDIKDKAKKEVYEELVNNLSFLIKGFNIDKQAELWRARTREENNNSKLYKNLNIEEFKYNILDFYFIILQNKKYYRKLSKKANKQRITT